MNIKCTCMFGSLVKPKEKRHACGCCPTGAGPTIIYIKEIIRFNNHYHPRATPLPPDKGLLSMRASSPNSWGELIISRVPCSPHTQLSRPMSWGHYILESRTTENTQHVCHAHRYCTVHRKMLHRMLVGLRVMKTNMTMNLARTKGASMKSQFS